MSSIYKSESGKAEVLGRYQALLRQWPVAHRTRCIQTSQGTTFVIESGSPQKPALILLPGSVSNSLTWMGDVAVLSQSHHVIAVDIIGEAGFSDSNRPAYTSGLYAQWLKELVDELGVEKFALAGISLGAWMSLEFATTHPGRVSHLCLLCPSGVVRECRRFLLKAVFYMCCGQWGKDRLVKMVNGGQLPDSEGMADAFEFMALVGEHFRPRTAKMMLFTDAALGRLSMPVLVICGECDGLIPPRQTIQRLRQQAANVQSVLLHNTGHAISGQGPTLVEFLNSY